MSRSRESLSLLHGLSRREWLRVGGLGCLGLSLSNLLTPAVQSAALPAGVPAGSFGRAKSCLLIFLVGGPPQHETFDPKPDAPPEIRGPFRSIPTRIPGVHFSELLPRAAQVAQHLTIVRSMYTDVNAHSASGHFMLTGYPHPAGQAETPAGPEDWPSLAAVVGALRPSERTPFSSVVLPEPIVNNPNIPWPGQNGGLMGATWHPHLIKCDPAAEPFRIDGMELPAGVDSLRLESRQSLLSQLDRHFLQHSRSDAVSGFDKVQQQAFDVVRSGSTRAAFELQREAPSLRDRYGRTKFGQSLLLGRRLIEAGVRLVQVNWPREAGDTTIGNPVWDTHSKNAERCKEVLCPQFDLGFATLIEDLQERGLLDETLVVAMGEFGRSPKINVDGGRDHWGHCFSLALAGAGLSGGRVVGASDKQGGYPIHRPIRPPELAATIFHLLGISPRAEFNDPLARPRAITADASPVPDIIA